MASFGFHASHEQFSPKELFDCVRAAEQAGFAGVMSSDHITPWSEQQGQSGFAWSWLGAAMQATTLPFGIITVPSGWRYHPAIVAQAGATLAQMFPGRLPWMALGSGQALNEHVVGRRWPEKGERNARLGAAVEIIRALWAGATVTRRRPIPIEEAKLYTLPKTLPQLIGAALSPATAEWAAGWADGLITINQPRDQLRRIIDAFRRGGGEDKPLFLQVHVSFAGSETEARRNAYDQWRSNAISASVAETLRTPQELSGVTKTVRPEDLDEHVRISADLGRQIEWLEEDAAMGFREIYVHNVGRNQLQFIEAFGKRLPRTS